MAGHLCDLGVGLGPQAQEKTSQELATENSKQQPEKEKGLFVLLLPCPSPETGFLRLHRPVA